MDIRVYRVYTRELNRVSKYRVRVRVRVMYGH